MFDAVHFLIVPFVASLMTLGILTYLGMHVLEREIIFIDISLAQIAATGATAAFILFPGGYAHGHDHSTMIPRIFSIGFTVAAAAFFSFTAKKITRISQETIIGVSYAIAAAATLFLLATAAGSDVHMEEMLTGSILWAQWSNLLPLAVVYTLVGGIHAVFRKQFINLTRNYHDKERQGSAALWWDFMFYALMGVVITFTVEFIGVLLTFAFLIIPATFSALFFRNWAFRLIAAWAMGMIVVTAGLYMSYSWDITCGPGLVALMGIVLALAAGLKSLTGGLRLSRGEAGEVRA